jgi:hypothetical protein
MLVKRMRNLIMSSINGQIGIINPTPELERQVDDLIKQSLERLRIVRVKPRWKDWSLAFKSLLIPIPGKEEEGGLDLVVCDGFSDGFWAERWADEQSKSRPRGKAGLRGGAVTVGGVMEDIGRLRKDLGAVVILSVQGLWVRSNQCKR